MSDHLPYLPHQGLDGLGLALWLGFLLFVAPRVLSWRQPGRMQADLRRAARFLRRVL